MRSHVYRPRWNVALVAAATAASMGVAAVLGLSAAAAGAFTPALAAAGLFGVALLTVVTLGWVQPLWLLVLTLPLPAVYSSDTARLPPILFMTALAVFGWFLSRARDRRPLLALPEALAPILALLAAVLLASAFADQIVPAFRETVNFILFAGLFAMAVDVFASDRRHVDEFATWIAVAAAGAGIAAGLEAAGFFPGRFFLAGTGFNRAAGGFGWPNELAMFLAISAPWLVYRARVAESATAKLLALSALAALGIGLAATFSRGSWLAVLLSPTVLLLVGERRFVVRYWTVLLLAALVADVATGGALSTRILSTAQDALVVQRLLLTGAGLLMFQSSPIVGVGPGGFGDALQRFGPQVSGLFDFVGSAQNGYVHVAAEMGVFGLLAFLYLIASTWLVLLRSARRARRSSGEDTRASFRDRALRVALLWSFTAVCLVSFFEWPFAHGVGELIVLVAAAGRVLARDASVSGEHRPAEVRSPSPA
jgi:putative inorganic carbon (HCO3(-)) transporter